MSRTRPAMQIFFFLLHAAKVRSSCEEGPGQSALQSAWAMQKKKKSTSTQLVLSVKHNQRSFYVEVSE